MYTHPTHDINGITRSSRLRFNLTRLVPAQYKPLQFDPMRMRGLNAQTRHYLLENTQLH